MLNTKLRQMLATAIVWFHILTHGGIAFCDYLQFVPLLDFVRRADGTASVPDQLLPLETIYAGITGMAFGTVGLTFVLALVFGDGVVTLRSAATTSLTFHALWTLHLLLRWEVWNAMMHPDGALNPTFFLLTHTLWIVLAIVLLLILPLPPPSAAADDETKRKKKTQ